MKYALSIALAGVLLFSGSASADPPGGSSDVCRAPDVCFAVTSLNHVDQGAIRTSRKTTATWALKCRQGQDRTVQRGVTEPGALDLVSPELSNPNCKLRARGTADGIARVRVALVN